MTRPDHPFGFRVVGPVTGARRLVDAAAALSGHAGCDPRADTGREAYLSAFRFGPDFRAHLAAHDTPKGFAGPCWSPWLWLDIDRPDPEAALTDVRRLTAFALERYRKLDDDDPLVFFSGGKGYHVGIPLPHHPDPSAVFHRVSRRYAEGLAAAAGVRIDPALYDRVRCLRAPNSRHPRTGLHKRRLLFGELMGLTAARIAELAREPAPFEVPRVGELVTEIEADWRAAVEAVERERSARQARPRSHDTSGRLQRATLDFIREGAEDGERHTRLFRAASNLREFGAPEELVHALLIEAALDSGLPPAEVRRVIRCGIDNTDRRGESSGTEGGAA